MKIQKIDTYRVAVPLHTPFKTALRTVTVAESIYVKITCDNGITGWGEAPPTHVITGESLSSIEYAIQFMIEPAINGESVLKHEWVFERLQTCCVGNSSAKAAIDMAIYDCLAKACDLPLFQLLGGYRSTLETDYTVSVNDKEQMLADAQNYVNNGFAILKIKAGKDDIEKDLERIRTISYSLGNQISIRLDANQGWTVKEAIYAIRKMEQENLPVELVEQPVKAWDIEGLKQVKEQTSLPVMADESVFSFYDAKRVLETKSVDLINIKLMKAGGIHQALKINHLAECYGVECMVGSMIETKLGITAAAHFAASQKNVTRVDFDAPLMLKKDPIAGGVNYDKSTLTFPADSGLGLKEVQLDRVLS